MNDPGFSNQLKTQRSLGRKSKLYGRAIEEFWVGPGIRNRRPRERYGTTDGALTATFGALTFWSPTSLSYFNPAAAGFICFMDVITIVIVVAALFIIISICEPLADRIRLPYSVVLAVIGALIGAAIITLFDYAPNVLGPTLADAIFQFRVRANFLLYVLLPTLLFQVSLGLNLRRMADDWVPILVMAVLAVVVATFTIGFALAPFTALPLVACFMCATSFRMNAALPRLNCS